MCSILCPLEPIYSCSVLRKTSCKTALHWVKIFSSLLHHGSLKLFSEVLPSNPFTRQTWGKMQKTNLSLLHAFDLLPGPFSRLQFTPRQKQVTAQPLAKSGGNSRRKVFLFFLQILQSWLRNDLLIHSSPNSWSKMRSPEKYNRGPVKLAMGIKNEKSLKTKCRSQWCIKISPQHDIHSTIRIKNQIQLKSLYM